MSLKYFHLFFIATTLGLMAFVVYWGSGRHSNPLLISAAAAIVLGLGYLRWFLRKYRYLP